MFNDAWRHPMNDQIAGSTNAAMIRQAEALEKIANTLEGIAATQTRIMVQVTTLAAAMNNRRQH